VLPVKEMDGAKQRLAGLLTPPQRRALAETMLGEVLAALTAARGLAGLILVTLEPVAIAAAERHGARVVTEDARAGHTGSVAAALRLLEAEGRGGALIVPGDIPAVTAADIDSLLAAHRPAPAFTIAPAHDAQGSNAVLLSPPRAVPLRFGEDSYLPHLAAARAQGIEPTIVTRPGIAMDIDHPADLRAFARLPQAAGTRTLALLRAFGVLP
jgi:2-phospho-L-lactate guanylyltransferase